MEELEKSDLTPRDIIFRYGLIAGGFAILFTFVLYMIDPALIFGYTPWIALAVLMGISVLASVKRKSVNGGQIAYGDAVVTSLATFSIGETISTLFMMLMYFVIDKSLLGKMKEIQMDKMDSMLRNGTINKVQYTAAQSSIENMNGNTILFYSITGVIVIIIIGLLIFLLTSIFIKNESPFKKELN